MHFRGIASSTCAMFTMKSHSLGIDFLIGFTRRLSRRQLMKKAAKTVLHFWAKSSITFMTSVFLAIYSCPPR